MQCAYRLWCVLVQGALALPAAGSASGSSCSPADVRRTSHASSRHGNCLAQCSGADALAGCQSQQMLALLAVQSQSSHTCASRCCVLAQAGASSTAASASSAACAWCEQQPKSALFWQPCISATPSRVSPSIHTLLPVCPTSTMPSRKHTAHSLCAPSYEVLGPW